MRSFTGREWSNVNGNFHFDLCCARKTDQGIRTVAWQLRITGLQADVQKENKNRRATTNLNNR